MNLFNGAIPAAGTYVIARPEAYSALEGVKNPKVALLQAKMTFGSAGGTSVLCYLQTSLDGGVTWVDCICAGVLVADALKFIGNSTITSAGLLTASDGALGADTVNNGVLGTKWRLKLIVAGTYAADTILRIDAELYN